MYGWIISLCLTQAVNKRKKNQFGDIIILVLKMKTKPW